MAVDLRQYIRQPVFYLTRLHNSDIRLRLALDERAGVPVSLVFSVLDWAVLGSPNQRPDRALLLAIEDLAEPVAALPAFRIG